MIHGNNKTDTVFKNRNKLIDLLKFAASSFSSFMVELIIYTCIIYFTRNADERASVIISNVVARVISCTVNFTINRRFVFRSHEPLIPALIKFYPLAAMNLALNTFLLSIIVETAPLPKIPAKLLTDALLFIVNWGAQRLIVFPDANQPNAQ